MERMDWVINVPQCSHWKKSGLAVEQAFITQDNALNAKRKWGELMYIYIKTYKGEAVQVNLYMRQSGMDLKDQEVKNLLLWVGERIAWTNWEEDEVKWRDQLVTIGKDQVWFLETDKHGNRSAPATDSRGKNTRRHKQCFKQCIDETPFVKESTPFIPPGPRNQNTTQWPCNSSKHNKRWIRHYDFVVAHITAPPNLVGRGWHVMACTWCSCQSFVWPAYNPPGPKILSAESVGKLFGSLKRKYTKYEDGREAPEKKEK